MRCLSLPTFFQPVKSHAVIFGALSGISQAASARPPFLIDDIAHAI